MASGPGPRVQQQQPVWFRSLAKLDLDLHAIPALTAPACPPRHVPSVPMPLTEISRVRVRVKPGWPS